MKPQWPARLAIAGAALALALVAVPVSLRLTHDQKIYPGAKVAGVDLGGMDKPTAIRALQAAGLDPALPIRLRAQAEPLTLRPQADGIALDLEATADRALAFGRGRGLRARAWEPLIALATSRVLSPVVRVDEARLKTALTVLAASFDRPARDATVVLEGARAKAIEAQSGRRLDQAASFTLLAQAAAEGQWPLSAVNLPVEVAEPAVKDLGSAWDEAQALLAGPIDLRAGEDRWELAPEALAPMLRPVAEGSTVRLTLDKAALADWLKPVTEAISQSSRLPRFAFLPEEGRLKLLESGQRGQRLDLDATAAAILGAGQGPRLARLTLTYEDTAVKDTATAVELGIKEVVAEASSRFVGSAPGRVHNVALAASRYDGLLVPPGAIVSFNEFLGDVSEAEGYKKTLIIVDGATQDGVGGGVCQVSTTMFRAAFWGGFPIVERHAHGYRVGYYEQGAPPGFDATIYSPVVDFRWQNDTEHWLLLSTWTNKAGAVTNFTIYGTKPAREVKMGPVIKGKAVPPPPPRTELDPKLPPGTQEIKEYARDGMSVSLSRVIVEGDQERTDAFNSHYVPTGQLVLLGPPLESAPPAPSP